jgi:hypothetical protein
MLPTYCPSADLSALTQEQLELYRVDFNVTSFLVNMGWALAIYIMAFSLLEKVNKQKFVVANTNAKTKKLTL